MIKLRDANRRGRHGYYFNENSDVLPKFEIQTKTVNAISNIVAIQIDTPNTPKRRKCIGSLNMVATQDIDPLELTGDLELANKIAYLLLEVVNCEQLKSSAVKKDPL